MLSKHEDQHERRETLRNDLSVRQQEQGSTMHAHAQADAETPRGRFSAVSAATVIGSKSDVAGAYPAAAAAHQTEVPPEPPLGYRIDAMEPLGLSPSAEAQGNSPNPASGEVVPFSASLDVEQRGAGLGPFSSHAFRRF